MMTSSTASPGGPTATTATERLQGSLRHSAIARLLVEGRLSSPAVAAVTASTDKVNDRGRRLQVEVVARSSPPPPIDLSTNRGNNASVAAGDPKEQVVTVSDSSSVASAAAAAASFTLSTITTMEKLRCILSYEIQSLLLRGDFSDQSRSGSSSSSNSSTIQYSCRLCSFAFSNVIDLLDHYRLHGDTLAHLGHKSPDILSQWFDYYLKTSPIHCSASSPQSLSAVSESLGVMTPTTAAADRGSSPTSRLDLRTLLLKPFKASTTNTLLLSSSADRPAPTRHRTNSESHPLRLGGRGPTATAVDGTHSRSSTPYTMISGLTDDENQQGQPTLVVFAAAADRCLRRGPTNGRQGGAGGGGGVYPGEGVVSVKYEADDITTTSPARSPLSTYSAHSSSAKDKGGGGGPHSQDSQSSGPECLGLQFQNGRLHRLTEEGGRMAEERSPPTLKCEVDDGGGGGGGGRGGSPSYGEDRVVTSHCFELDDDRYLTLTNLRDHHHHHPHPKETLQRKSSNISRLLHPGLRASDDRSPISHGYGSHPGSSVSPTMDPAMDHPREDTGNQSRSPPRETVVEQEYAYKQYKRLRKSNAPKSYRQEIESSISLCTHSLSKTPDDSALSGTPSLPYDGSEGHPQRTGLTQLAGPERGRITERVPRGYDVGVQCSLITPAEPWIAMTEGDDEEEEDDDEVDNETREGSNGRGRRRCMDRRMRVGRKRAFPADENEMPDITAVDADCGGGGGAVQMRCSPCGITFDDDVIFSIHIGCHSHTDPFVCNICGRPCDNKYAFNTHILRGHHPT